MDDFTVEFNNIPKDSFYGGNEQVLRAILWHKLDKVIGDQHFENTMTEIGDDSKFDIAEISFARNDQNDVVLLSEMNLLR